jgi:hypothetical protein
MFVTRNLLLCRVLNRHGKLPRMAKPVYSENVSTGVWVDIEPLKARDLFLYEDSDG